jgi:adenine-specific DNA-methyltransferase
MQSGSSSGAASTPSPKGAAVPRLPLASADPLAPRFEELKALFPMAVTDGRVDLDKLRALLGEATAAGPERYGLSWAGKSDALKTLRQQTTATLLPAPSESVDWDTTGNAIIEGDNLEVLKVLQRAYHGKVKLIYIDPPYNTGGDFIYPDDYSEGLNSYLQFTRQATEEGVKLTTNVNTSGRYHSRWLTMMYPRLFLARNLLREDGVIFVSIDDHEVHNLRLLMDEIFGEENLLGCVTWQKKYAPANDKADFSASHDYLLAYARSRPRDSHGKIVSVLARESRSDAMNAAYENPDNDPRGPWKPGDYTCNKSADERPRLYYPITNPHTGEDVLPKRTRVWAYSREAHEENVRDNRVWWGPEGRSRAPAYKRFLSEVSGVVAQTVWLWSEVGHNDEAKKELLGLFPDATEVFGTPKPTELIKKILLLSTSTDGSDLVLDFFAGSGTTGQAVLDLNQEDCGNRQFILVQLPEPTGREDFPTIAEVTKERMRRVISRMEPADEEQLALAAGEKPDLGFKVFKLAPSNFSVWDPALAAADAADLGKQWELTADNVRAAAGEQALLQELMLKSGLPLSAPVAHANAAGLSVHVLDEGRLLICLARELTREALRAMIDLKPQSVLCLDVGFKGRDALKVNAQLEFACHDIQFRTA